LHCAREVFAEYGYHGGTIAEIVRRADVSTPVLYHHFGSKSGLFRAAINDISELLLEARGPAIGSAGTLRENIDAMLRSAIDIHDADPQLARFLLTARVEAARDPELVVMTELTDYNSSRLEGFRVLAAESGLSPRRADAVAHACVTIFGGLTVIAFSSPLDYDKTVESARLLLDSDLFDS
jgi:AcrR family transcriptional regulator